MGLRGNTPLIAKGSPTSARSKPHYVHMQTTDVTRGPGPTSLQEQARGCERAGKGIKLNTLRARKYAHIHTSSHPHIHESPSGHDVESALRARPHGRQRPPAVTSLGEYGRYGANTRGAGASALRSHRRAARPPHHNELVGRPPPRRCAEAAGRWFWRGGLPHGKTVGVLWPAPPDFPGQIGPQLSTFSKIEPSVASSPFVTMSCWMPPGRSRGLHARPKLARMAPANEYSVGAR